MPMYFQDFIVMAKRLNKYNDHEYYIKKELIGLKHQSFSSDYEIAKKIGWTDDSGSAPLLNKIHQVHLPYLNSKNIVNLYGTVKFETNK